MCNRSIFEDGRPVVHGLVGKPYGEWWEQPPVRTQWALGKPEVYNPLCGRCCLSGKSSQCTDLQQACAQVGADVVSFMYAYVHQMLHTSE